MNPHSTALPRWTRAVDADEDLVAVRRRGPVQPVRLPDGPDVWLVTRYHEARQALTDPRLVKDPSALRHPDHGFGGCRYRDDVWSVFGRHILNSDGTAHGRRRVLYKRFLGPRVVDRYRRPVEQFTERYVTGLADIIDPDLVRDFGEPVSAAVLAQVLGIPEEYGPELTRCGSAVIRGDLPAEMTQSLIDLRALSLAIAADRHRVRPDGLVAALLDLREHGEWTLREVADEITALIVAGTTTTAAFLAHGAAVIADDPALRRHTTEPSMTAALIEELLRYRSSAGNTTWRFTTEELELGGVVIPEGAIVLVSIASANRDESVYPASDSVDPQRNGTTPPHLGFGYGQHFCAGAPLARLVAAVALPALFRRYPRMRCTIPLTAIEWQIAVVGWRPTAVPIVIDHTKVSSIQELP